jgi:hypothetical protein
MATTLDTRGKVLAESLLRVLEVENMFDAYCVAARWKEELERLRQTHNPHPPTG